MVMFRIVAFFFEHVNSKKRPPLKTLMVFQKVFFTVSLSDYPKILGKLTAGPDGAGMAGIDGAGVGAGTGRFTFGADGADGPPEKMPPMI